VPQLSEWLELMLAEIARKQDDERCAEEERTRRLAASEPQRDARAPASGVQRATTVAAR